MGWSADLVSMILSDAINDSLKTETLVWYRRMRSVSPQPVLISLFGGMGVAIMFEEELI